MCPFSLYVDAIAASENRYTNYEAPNSDTTVETNNQSEQTEITIDEDEPVSGNEIEQSEGEVGEVFEGDDQTFPSDTIEEEVLSLNSDMNLEQDMTISKLELNGHQLRLNNHKLVINGNLRLTDGSILANGELIVNGNFETLEEDTGSIGFYFLDTKITVSGDFTYLGQTPVNESRKLNLIVGGDVTIGNSFTTEEYLFKLELNGTKKQMVTVPDDLRIGIVTVENTSEEGVFSINPIKKYRCIDKEGKLTYEGQRGIQGFTLSEDKVIEEEFILGEGTLDLNGHELLIKGDFIQEGGEVLVNGGKLVIEGDYRLQKEIETIEIKEYGNSYGTILMNNQEDYVEILGDFYCSPLMMNDTHYTEYSYYETVNHLSEGKMVLNGDFICREQSIEFDRELGEEGLKNAESDWENEKQPVIRAGYGGSFLFSFNGDKKQSIIGAEGIEANQIELTGQEHQSIYSDVYMSVLFWQISNKNIMYTYHENNILCLNKYSLKEDLEFAEDILIKGDINLGGHTFYAKRNVIQENAALTINKGKLLIDGNYTMEAGIQWNDSGSSLKMESADDYVLVKGDFHNKTTANHKGLLTSGLLEIQGNITLESECEEGFYPQENYRVLLSGTKEQKVKSKGIEFAKFSNVEIQNESKEGIIFENSPYISGELKTNGNKVSGTLGVGEEFTVFEGVYLGDIKILKPYTIKQSVTYHGNVEAIDQVSVYLQDEASMSVSGNFIGEGCELSSSSEIEKFVVGGNLNLKKLNIDSNYLTLECKGDVSLEGKVKLYEYSSLILNGDKKQSVNTGEEVIFDYITLDNKSDEGIESKTGLVARKEFVHNNCRLVYGDTEGTYGYILKEDTDVSGDFYLKEGTLDLNGHTMTIQGDFWHQGGKVCLNGGTLIVKGDYRMEIRDGDTCNFGTGKLIMNSDADTLVVHGDAHMNTRFPYYTYLNEKMTKGVIRLYGNYKKSILNTYFVLNEGITVEIDGEKEQDIEARGSFDVTELKILKSGGTVRCNVNVSVGKLQGNGEFLDKSLDVSVQTIEDVDCTKIGGSLSIYKGGTLSHDMDVAGELSISGGTFSILDFQLSAGSIEVAGTLDVARGDIYCENNFLLKSYGKLIMRDPLCYLLVNGNFSTNSYSSSKGNMTNGTLEVRGDFLQSGSSDSFIAESSHCTILGRKKLEDGSTYIPEIRFYGEGYSKFQKLILTKDKDTGYRFKNNIDKIANEIIYQLEDDENPTAVNELKADEIGCNFVTLSYGGASDDTGIVGYEIYRDGKRIGVTSELTFRDTGLKPGHTHEYQVYAFDNYRNKTKDSPVLRVEIPKDIEAPEKVEDLGVRKRTGSSVTLTWKATTDNDKVAGYIVYRNGEKIKSGLQDTTYCDSHLELNKSYSYTIAAYDESGNYSEESEAIKAFVKMPQILNVTPENYADLGGTTTKFEIKFGIWGGRSPKSS